MSHTSAPTGVDPHRSDLHAALSTRQIWTVLLHSGPYHLGLWARMMILCSTGMFGKLVLVREENGGTAVT